MKSWHFSRNSRDACGSTRAAKRLKAIVRLTLTCWPTYRRYQSLPNRQKRAVTEVKAFQVWDVRENEKAPWREAMVVNLSRVDRNKGTTLLEVHTAQFRHVVRVRETVFA
jgi:hypothetical protein